MNDRNPEGFLQWKGGAVRGTAEMIDMLNQLRPLGVMLDRLERFALTDGAVWVWPYAFGPAISEYGDLPVVRALVQEPMIGLPGRPHKGRT